MPATPQHPFMESSPLSIRRAEPAASPVPLLLTEPEAARALGCSPKTIYNLRRSGALAYVRLGSSGIRYAITDLQRFIEAARQTTAGPLHAGRKVDHEHG